MNEPEEIKRLNNGKITNQLKVQTFQDIGKERPLSENQLSVKSNNM